jgi:hypothetical protein
VPLSAVDCGTRAVIVQNHGVFLFADGVSRILPIA